MVNGATVDGGGGEFDAVAEVGDEAGYYQDGGGVEEDYVSGWALYSGKDLI
jgi:hypothetical protein